jgi:hypothetical protein
MITVIKSYQITRPSVYTSTYNYTWESSSSCVSITPSSGVSTGIVTSQFTFLDESCLTNTTFILHVIDVNGCKGDFPISISNPCSALELSSISEQPGYLLNATASSPNCSAVNFSWRVDESLFSLQQTFNSSFSSAVQLSFKNTVQDFPASSVINLRATDCNGCVKETNYTILICKPAVSNVIANLYCTSGSYASSPIFIPNPTGCANFTPNWNTLSFINTNNFSIVREANLTLPNYISVSTRDLSTVPGFYSAFYNVEDQNGITSQNGTISIIVYPCTGSPISIPDFTYQIDCTAEAGDLVDIPLSNRIFTTAETVLDWNTWQLVLPPTPLSSNITLYTDIQGNHFIRYEVPAVSGSDVFRWSICDTLGNCAQSSTYTIILDCATPPVLTADTTCAGCGNSKIINVLDNDVPGGSPMNLSTLTITSLPQYGTAIPLPDGTILYNANPNYAGSDIFSYTISNVSGSTAVPVNVVVDIVCAGEGGEVTLCNE